MKLLAGLLLALLSTSTFAQRISIHSSWEKIEASFSHIVLKPSELNPVGGLFNACIAADGETFHSIKDVKFCAEGHQEEVRQGDSVFWEWVCDRHESSPLSQSRTISKRECTDYAQEGDNFFCRAFEDKPFRIPLSYLLEVQDTGMGEAGPRTLFKKPYTIPQCD